MRLVHDEERHARAPEQVEVLRVLEPLGRHVDEREIALPYPVDRLPLRRHAQRRVELGGGDVGLGQLLSLILHQRDERRDDDGWPRQEQRGELITKRLAGPRREEPQGVPPGQHRLDELALARPEGLHAEPLARHLPDVLPARRAPLLVLHAREHGAHVVCAPCSRAGTHAFPAWLRDGQSGYRMRRKATLPRRRPVEGSSRLSALSARPGGAGRPSAVIPYAPQVLPSCSESARRELAAILANTLLHQASFEVGSAAEAHGE